MRRRSQPIFNVEHAIEEWSKRFPTRVTLIHFLENEREDCLTERRRVAKRGPDRIRYDWTAENIGRMLDVLRSE